jgi:hypothetical protein
MVDYNFDPSLSGTAGDFMGQVGGYNIGPQIEPTFTTPAASSGSFDFGGYYTPTFDFASYLPQSSYVGQTPTFQTLADFPAGPQAGYSFVSPTSQGGFYTPPAAPVSTAPAARTVGGVDVSKGTTAEPAAAPEAAAKPEGLF